MKMRIAWNERVAGWILRIAARHHRGDEFGQLRGAFQRLRCATRDDRARDAARLAFFAVGEQHIGDLAVVGAREPLRGAFARIGIHAHVERAVFREREAAFGDIQLRRGHAEVEQHAIEAFACEVPGAEVGEGAAADA